MERLKIIKEALKVPVRCIWEHQYTMMLKADSEMKSYINQLKIYDPINARDSLQVTQLKKIGFTVHVPGRAMRDPTDLLGTGTGVRA